MRPAKSLSKITLGPRHRGMPKRQGARSVLVRRTVPDGKPRAAAFAKLLQDGRGAIGKIHHVHFVARSYETARGAVRYAHHTGDHLVLTLARWPDLIRFLADGTLVLDTNSVQNQIRPIALTRKNDLFAGNEVGAESWAMLASLVAT